MVLDALLGRNGFQVGFLWRVIGAGLVACFLLLTQQSASFRQALYQIDTSIIDQWQRLSTADEPSGTMRSAG